MNKNAEWYKNKLNYINKFTKEKYRYINLFFNREKDAEILDYLDSLESKTAYVKELIKKDMKEKGLL